MTVQTLGLYLHELFLNLISLINPIGQIALDHLRILIHVHSLKKILPPTTTIRMSPSQQVNPHNFIDFGIKGLLINENIILVLLHVIILLHYLFAF